MKDERSESRYAESSRAEPDTYGTTSTTIKITVEYLKGEEVHLFQILANPGTQARDVLQTLAPQLGGTGYEIFHHPKDLLPFEYPMLNDESVYKRAVMGYKFYLKAKPNALARLIRWMEVSYYINNKEMIERRLKDLGL